MKDSQLKLTIALARTHTYFFQEIESMLKNHGLNISEFGVLEFLLHKGDQPVQKIAEKILVSSGTITYNIDKLMKRGLVEKKKCSIDQRVYYVSLTPEGREMIEFLFPFHKAHLKSICSSLTIKEQEQLIELLLKLEGHQ